MVRHSGEERREGGGDKRGDGDRTKEGAGCSELFHSIL